MKLKIEYQSKKFFAANLPYLTGFLLLNIILITVMIFNLIQYNNNNQKIILLLSEIEEYNSKKSLLDFKSQVIEEEVDLDHINKVLTQLVPLKEDYFSILASLEKL